MTATAVDTPVADVRDLAARAQAGDRDAFGAIYDRYVTTVYRYIHRRVGDRQLAEDLTSDTFLRALKRIGDFTWQGRDPGAWLVTIARNLVVDHYKSGRYRLELTTGDVYDPDHIAPGADTHVIRAALTADVRAAVAALPADQRVAAYARFLEELSIAETVDLLDITEGAVKARTHRAVQRLGRDASLRQWADR